MTKSQRISRAVLTSENLSASVLMGCKTFADADISDIAAELKRQTAAINSGDMTRAENMLVAQAHTLDGLFANLLGRGLMTAQPDKFEMLLRLALKAQNQSRATLQTLNELKAPKQVAFVKQANIGNQVQVNNSAPGPYARTQENQNTPNELLEVQHGERLDTRAKGSSGSADQAMEPMAKQHRAKKPRG
ncbi:MAG: hypothetical protein K2Y24_17465 [Pseudomonadaceae bacterium]|nr:hypothetical protein [Pseudomonadaceae bacterium]